MHASIHPASPLQPSLLRYNTKPLQIPLQHFTHIPNRPRLHRHRRLDRVRAHVRHQHHTGVRQQARMHGGFVLVDVQPDAADLTAGQGVDEGGFVHDAAAGGVDDDGAGFEEGELGVGEGVAGVVLRRGALLVVDSQETISEGNREGYRERDRGRLGSVLTFNGKCKLNTSLSLNNVSKSTYSAPPHSSLSTTSLSLIRLQYLTRIPNPTAILCAKFLPIPPIPKIPNTFPRGSRPNTNGASSSPDRHTPRRKFPIPCAKFRNAPSSKKTAVSAVLSSTAVRTLLTLTPRAVQAATSIWSYPAPLWQINFKEGGKAARRSASMRPVRETESKVR